MGVVLAAYGSRRGVEPLMGLASPLQALGTPVQVCAPPEGAAVEGRPAPVASGAMPTGGWR